MKPRHLLIAAAGLMTVLAATLPSVASAHGRGGFGHGFGPGHFHHGGARVGVFVGVPLVAPWYGPSYAYPYYPAPVYYPPAPVTYVEQPQVAAAPAAGIWYYCSSAQAYYPYVKQCAEGWQQVPASPAR